MQIIDIFSGIGGFSLAGDWMGWRTIQFCEINPFGQKVLAYHFPGVPIHDNIKTLTAEQIINNGLYDKNETTILVGGVPCQPWSTAGKRLGKADDRDLWEESIALIGSLRPDFAVLENVRGLINWNGGVVFDEVQANLEAEGYEVLPFLLPACSVNAPHRRDRIWFIVYSQSNRNRRELPRLESQNGGVWESEKYRKDNLQFRDNGEKRDAADPEYAGLQRENRFRMEETIQPTEHITPDPDSGKRCERTDWEDFPTQSPVCTRNDGVSSELSGITFPKWRNESIKAYGNAIVPHVAFQIFKAIEQMNREIKQY